MLLLSHIQRSVQRDGMKGSVMLVVPSSISQRAYCLVWRQLIQLRWLTVNHASLHALGGLSLESRERDRWKHWMKFMSTLLDQSHHLMITDAKQRMRWCTLLKDKRLATEALKSWMRRMKTAYGKIPILMFSDGGGEVRNNDLNHVADLEGMRWDTTAAYIHEQNGIAESSNKVILDRARTLLIATGFRQGMWYFVVLHAKPTSPIGWATLVPRISLSPTLKKILDYLLQILAIPIQWTSAVKLTNTLTRKIPRELSAKSSRLGQWSTGLSASRIAHPQTTLSRDRNGTITGVNRCDIIISSHFTFQEDFTFGMLFNNHIPPKPVYGSV